MNKIYVFPVTPHPMGNCVYRAVAEDGEDLASQVASSEDWGKLDLGVVGEVFHYYKDKYTAKYPDGYTVEYVPDGSTHPVLAKFVQVEKAPNADSMQCGCELDIHNPAKSVFCIPHGIVCITLVETERNRVLGVLGVDHSSCSIGTPCTVCSSAPGPSNS